MLDPTVAGKCSGVSSKKACPVQGWRKILQGDTADAAGPGNTAGWAAADAQPSAAQRSSLSSARGSPAVGAGPPTALRPFLCADAGANAGTAFGTDAGYCRGRGAGWGRGRGCSTCPPAAAGANGAAASLPPRLSAGGGPGRCATDGGNPGRCSSCRLLWFSEP